MDRSDIQENLFSLYLRLNGYFVTGFIVHAAVGVKTEMDALAVRFPHHREPEREIGCSPALETSNNYADFTVCEVKGGKGRINYNFRFREDPEAVVSVLNRFGAFTDQEIIELVPRIRNMLDPNHLRKSRSFPTIELPHARRIRFLLVAPDQERRGGNGKPYIFGDDIISYLWQCFRPDSRRRSCAVRYNWDLWGEQYKRLVAYFKNESRIVPGNMDDIYNYCGLSSLKTPVTSTQ